METTLRPEARWLIRALFLTTFAALSSAAGAQAVAPPPSDLEPGVNTSATQTSSAEPPPAPAPARTPASTASKPAAAADKVTSAPGTASSAPSANAPSAASAPKAPAVATAGTGTTAAPKPGAAAAGKAHDSLQLDTTQITGNRELPKVLYIVPWKRSDLGDLVGKPVNSLLDEVLTPVDRDVFKRQNRYYDALKPDDAKDVAGTAAGADVKR